MAKRIPWTPPESEIPLFRATLRRWAGVWQTRIRKQTSKDCRVKLSYIQSRKFFRIELTVAGDNCDYKTQWAMVDLSGNIFATQKNGWWQALPGIRGNIFEASGLTCCDKDGPIVERKAS